MSFPCLFVTPWPEVLSSKGLFLGGGGGGKPSPAKEMALAGKPRSRAVSLVGGRGALVKALLNMSRKNPPGSH